MNRDTADVDTGLKLMETEDAKEEIRMLLRDGWFLMTGDYETIALIVGLYLREGGDWREAYEIGYGDLSNGELFDIVFVCRKNERMLGIFERFGRGLDDLSRTLLLQFSGRKGSNVMQFNYVEGRKEEGIEEVIDYVSAGGRW